MAINRVARERHERGHDFSFSPDRCSKCEMTLEDYEDHGKPSCTGKPPPRSQSPSPGN
jgi:hypothetical protein